MFLLFEIVIHTLVVIRGPGELEAEARQASEALVDPIVSTLATTFIRFLTK